MELKLSTCFITVDDHDKALAFYRDILGFAVGADVRHEGMRWLTVSPPSQPDLHIVMTSPGANPNVSKDDQRIVAELLAMGILPGLIFTTPNVDVTFEQIFAPPAPRCYRSRWTCPMACGTARSATQPATCCVSTNPKAGRQARRGQARESTRLVSSKCDITSRTKRRNER
jgi:hypothetical protein